MHGEGGREIGTIEEEGVRTVRLGRGGEKEIKLRGTS